MKRLLIPVLTLVLTFEAAPADAYGGPSNIVVATNHTDGRLVVQGRVQFVRVAGEVAAPLNFAMAQGTTCTGCRTLAVALQLGLASANAAHVGPQNVAVATNAACADCVTIAKA